MVDQIQERSSIAVITHPLTMGLLICFPVGIVAILIVLLLIDINKWLHLPPGPMPLPFIGNKLSLPKTKPWLQLDKWAKEYGTIYTICTVPFSLLFLPSLRH